LQRGPVGCPGPKQGLVIDPRAAIGKDAAHADDLPPGDIHHHRSLGLRNAVRGLAEVDEPLLHREVAHAVGQADGQGTRSDRFSKLADEAEHVRHMGRRPARGGAPYGNRNCGSIARRRNGWRRIDGKAMSTGRSPNAAESASCMSTSANALAACPAWNSTSRSTLLRAVAAPDPVEPNSESRRR
jgi:hypothetical protein